MSAIGPLAGSTAASAAALQPPASRRDDVHAGARARRRSRSCSSTPGGDVDPLVSVLAATALLDIVAPSCPSSCSAPRARDPVPDGRDQPRLLAAQLTAPVWKALHMGVYVAYALIVLHVASACCSRSAQPWLARRPRRRRLLVVVGLHLVAARRERRDARGLPRLSIAPWRRRLRRRRHPGTPRGDRLPVRRARRRLPLRAIACRRSRTSASTRTVRSARAGSSNGCVVCPWHGYQYLPETGASPPPFTEKSADIPRADRRAAACWSIPRPNPPGTYVEPARIDGAARIA